MSSRRDGVIAQEGKGFGQATMRPELKAGEVNARILSPRVRGWLGASPLRRPHQSPVWVWALLRPFHD